jgi:hypothetical protein
VLALALPSKGRWFDLLLTLAFVNLDAPRGFACRFYVCADYASWQLALLRTVFFARAVFVDERKLPRAGMAGAYNYACDRARADGCEWIALWADDLLPARRRWLHALFPLISTPDFRFGILSSDEGGHRGTFGWNIFAGYPCAHFYVARIDALPGHMLNPRIRAYVGDNEICVSTAKRGLPIDFLPVQVVHQPTANPTRSANAPNYARDLRTVYELHPELAGRLDAVVLRGELEGPECGYVPDTGIVRRFGEVAAVPLTEFQRLGNATQVSAAVWIVGALRKRWNESLPQAAMRLRRALHL